MRLISLNDMNNIVLQQRRWGPFRNGANGLACPRCGDELQDLPGETIIQREDRTSYRNVRCNATKRDGSACDFAGIREVA